MVGADVHLGDLQRAQVEWLRLSVLSLGAVEFREVVQARGHIGMVRTKRPLTDLQRPPIERFSLCVLSLGAAEFREVVQARGYIGMVGTEGPLTDRQRAPVDRFSLSVLPLSAVDLREVVQARGYIRMVWADVHLGDLQGTLRHVYRTVVLASAIELRDLLIEDPPFKARSLLRERSGRHQADQEHDCGTSPDEFHPDSLFCSTANADYVT